MGSVIDEKVADAARALALRAGGVGEVCDREALRALNERADGAIPAWYIDLLATFPLAGLELGWQSFDPEPDFDGMTWIVIADVHMLEAIMLDAYPGMYLYGHGYLPFAYGSLNAGNVFVLETASGDPPIYEVWHDISQDPNVLVQAIKSGEPGTRVIDRALSSFLRSAPVGNT